MIIDAKHVPNIFFRGCSGRSTDLRQFEAIYPVYLFVVIRFVSGHSVLYDRYTISHSTPEVVPQLLCMLFRKFRNGKLANLRHRRRRPDPSSIVCYPNLGYRSGNLVA
jgi:hypothetical protein